MAPTSEPEITKAGVTVAKAIELKRMSRLVKTPVTTISANCYLSIGKLVSDSIIRVLREG
ncbi:GH23734 [Drosophila grimshawi]|uniref:GH23734 n=1 Tax=Drosophila grimshawi TaxID=7222 RepID=B4K1C2_DROGR|nr:GH23734 [Drosophila grimshawi]